MRIINLIENTEGMKGCKAAHGLSFYIETDHHKLLMDLGPSEETLENAKELGIDFGTIDTVILSHGHYDHSGGILPFAEKRQAGAAADVIDHSQTETSFTIYLQESAFGDYYADEGKHAEQRYRYIGVDKRIAELPQIKKLHGNYQIDEELALFTIPERSHELPFTNRSLLEKTGDNKTQPERAEHPSEFIRDNFEHEQYLVIHDEGMHVLMSGCAHNGILSILDEYRKLYGDDPDLVISGFHLMKKTDYKEEQIEEIRSIAKELKTYKSKFLTCHCTGLPAFEIMKEIMGEQLGYVSSGEEAKLTGERSVTNR